MTSELHRRLASRGAMDILPWLIGCAALVGYLATLNRSVSLSNLAQVAQLNGWDWQPVLLWPLEFIVTYPLRWLPETTVPVALNALAALCAALTLTLLARSAALLPQDRTPQQRSVMRTHSGLMTGAAAWVPPLLAAGACGLQLSFWLHATVGTGEMLKLLVFAYVIRCLLEFRVDGRQSWLRKAALVYGAGMANDWGMVAAFPLFIVALILLKGLAFFNPRFLTNMALFGLAGLSLLFLLPAVQAFTSDSGIGFWQTLRFEIVTSKNTLGVLFNRLNLHRRDVAVLLTLTSLAPVMVMCIRWRFFSADSSPFGVWMANLMFNISHALFLLVCVWVAFDPPFSPMHASGLLNLPMTTPFLKLYYLSCIAIGYYSGYFLVVFSKPTVRDLGYRPGGELRAIISHWICRGVTRAVWALALIAVVGLFYKNYPVVRAENTPVAARYGALTARCLPADRAIVLSDDPYRLYLLQTALAGQNRATNFVLLNTQMLPFGVYHNFLRKRYPGMFSTDTVVSPTNEFVNPAQLVRMMSVLAQTNSLWYAHPSFGYYFEQFYLQPNGLAYELSFYPTNQVSAPVPSEAQIRQNEKFWAQTANKLLDEALAAMRTPTQQEKIPLLRKFTDVARLRREPAREAKAIAAYYSRALNFWGVQLQRAGRLQDAARYFSRALELNPDNIAAEINQQYNATLQAGGMAPVEVSKSIDAELRAFRTLERAMNANGPFDEPAFCYNLGLEFAGGNNYRQAAQQFERVVELVPHNLEARLWLARFYNLWRLPDRALELVSEIRASAAPGIDSRSTQLQLALVEAAAQTIKSNIPATFQIIESALAQYPTDTNLLNVAAHLYLTHGEYSNALGAVERLLQLAPDDVVSLVSKGVILMQLNAHSNAVAPLSRALTLQPTNYLAMYNRAVAYLQIDRLDAAHADYFELSKIFPNAYQVYYGLGEIAYRKKDTNAAVMHYQNYLSNAIPDAAETKFVKDRLDALTRRTR